MILITGGAGFIGSNLVKAFNKKGRTDLIVVDDLRDGRKIQNIADCDIADYFDKDEWLELFHLEAFEVIDAVFHQGACSDTTEWDGQFMMKNNYDYSKQLLNCCVEYGIPFIYASSAAVYGNGTVFKEERRCEKPLNMYGYSKWQFDQYVRDRSFDSQVVGLRYFNVYGPREQHKGNMASVAFHFNHQILEKGVARLFEGTEGYSNGEQLRDFVYIDDVVDVNLWMLENPQVSGIFNVGTGRSQTFNEVANAVINYHQRGNIEYMPFPEKLSGVYQNFTQADLTALHAAGYMKPFATVEEGVYDYMKSLNSA